MAFDFEEYIKDNLDFRQQLSKPEEIQIDCINPECDDNWRHRKKMAVNTEKKVAYCFKCGITYKPIAFVAEVEGISRFAAMKIVKDGAARRTYGIGRLETAVKEMLEHKKTTPAPTMESPKPCLFPPLFKIEPGRPEWDYLLKREFNQKVIDHFGLYFSTRGTTGTLCPDCPIKKKGKRCCPYYNRIIIPVYQNGIAIAFQGRTILEDGVWGSKPKYLFPGDQNFHTALYNWDNAKYFRDLILVEGVTDAWRLWLMGFHNVCATFGKSLKPEQRAMIRKNSRTERVYVFWDGNALEKIYETVVDLSSFVEARAVELPEEMEPDTCPDPGFYLENAVDVKKISPLERKLRAKRLI